MSSPFPIRLRNGEMSGEFAKKLPTNLFGKQFKNLEEDLVKHYGGLHFATWPMFACANFFGQSSYEVLMLRVCPLIYTGDRPSVEGD